MPLKIPPPTGFVAPGFENVFSVLSDRFASGVEKGSSFAAYYRGRPVVNLWGGFADVGSKRLWKEDTVGFFYSSTKFVGTVTIAHLIDRGLLNYEEKIASYWPEFAQNGKENITLEMLLSYRAGLAALDDNFEVRWMMDNPQLLHDMLVKQKPFWTPGEAYGYHPITLGLYLNEIVKRVDKKGRSLSEYFQDEIAGPFGIDFFIGLPKPLMYRAVRLEFLPVHQETYDNHIQGFKGDLSLFQRNSQQPKDWNARLKLNDPDFMEIPLPSSHGAGTALAMAKLTGILADGGISEGRTLLSPQSIAKLQEPLSSGLDLTTSVDCIYGRGTSLFPVVEGKKIWYMFGHTGLGDQCVAADSQYKVGWAYTTNCLDLSVGFTNKNKWRPLVAALFDCVHRLENVQVQRRVLLTGEELKKTEQSLRRDSKL